jgi:hypothetical protein
MCEPLCWVKLSFVYGIFFYTHDRFERKTIRILIRSLILYKVGIYMCAPVYINIYICAGTGICIYVDMYVCVYVYVYICVYYIYVYICICMYMSMGICMYMVPHKFARKKKSIRFS